MANSPAHDPSNILTKPKFSFKHTPNQQRSTLKKKQNKTKQNKNKKATKPATPPLVSPSLSLLLMIKKLQFTLV